MRENKSERVLIKLFKHKTTENMLGYNGSTFTGVPALRRQQSSSLD